MKTLPKKDGAVNSHCLSWKSYATMGSSNSLSLVSSKGR